MEYPKLTCKDIVEKTVEIDANKLVTIKDVRISNPDNMLFIETREYGELSGKAFFLSSSFDWIVGRDGKECLILVPLRKNKS